MRPFRFFFMAAVGFIIFLAVAKVLFTALIIAAVFSLIYYVGRGIIHFFSRMSWDDHPRSYAGQQALSRGRQHYFQEQAFQGGNYMDPLRETITKIH